MALIEDTPAEPWDVWSRVITSSDYWKKDGTLHNNAFKGRAAFAELLGKRLGRSSYLEGYCH
jgi:hypothetical protein